MQPDPKLLLALSMVIEEQGFEKAANKLNITQSAITQRIHKLEHAIGEVLLQRSSPPILTQAGQYLLTYHQQLQSLNQQLAEQLLLTDKNRQLIRIGVNADSLATWLFDALEPVFSSNKFLFDIKVDDQDKTLELLERGEVNACITSIKNSLKGCNSFPIGSMTYRCLATPEFRNQYFSQPPLSAQPNTAEIIELLKAFEVAPAIEFNHKDELQNLYIRALVNSLKSTEDIKPIQITQRHRIPSTESYLDFICRGYGWGMVPDQQSEQARKSGKLIEIVPNITLEIPLYWHIWNLKTELNKQLTNEIRRYGNQHFKSI